MAALLGGIITTAIIGAGHTVITFIVALVAAALLVSAFTTRGYGRYCSRRRSVRWRWSAGAARRRPKIRGSAGTLVPADLSCIGADCRQYY